MTDYHSLQPDSKYLFQLVKKEDGSMTKAFVSTPNELCDFLESQDEYTLEDLYVNFVVDIGFANECKPDESLAMSDLIMTVPLLSAHSFRVLVGRGKGSLGDLSKYDESITDDDFNTPEEDEDNGEA